MTSPPAPTEVSMELEISEDIIRQQTFSDADHTARMSKPSLCVYIHNAGFFMIVLTVFLRFHLCRVFLAMWLNLLEISVLIIRWDR